MELKNASDSGEDLISLSVTLYQRGYIFVEPRELRRRIGQSQYLELICTFVDRHAVQRWWSDSIIQKNHRNAFSKLRRRPKIIPSRDVIVDVDAIKTCSCKKHSSLLLQGASIVPTGALICGECLHPLPNYAEPKGLDVETWSRLHSNVYDIWLSSGTLEMWARDQLADFDSDLNKAARKIVTKAIKHYKVPAFYILFVEDGSSGKCPRCGGKGTTSDWQKPQRVCKRCKIAYYT